MEREREKEREENNKAERKQKHILWKDFIKIEWNCSD